MVRVPDSESFGRMKAETEKVSEAVTDLQRTDGSQYARALEKIRALVAGLDAQVAAAITATSYTRAVIDGKVAVAAGTASSTGISGVIAPGSGGTGTTNAYSNVFSSGAWRATWSLTNGTLGYPPSLRALKQDITDAVIDVDAFLALPVQSFRYRDDVADNGDDAVWRQGFIAEDLEAAGLNDWLYRDAEGVLQGVAYEMLWAAHHEIIRNQAAEITELKRQQHNILTRLATLEGGT